MTEFSIFLSGIYKFKSDSIENRDDFVIGFFRAAGQKDTSGLTSEDNSIFRKICAGSRKLSYSLTTYFPKNPNLSKEKEYLKTAINELRIKEIFKEFGFDEDEKEDFDALCEAIAMQFENFMKYEDTPPTSVKSIYEVLIDKKGYSADPYANENALYAAKQMYYSALQSINSMQLDCSLLQAKGPIEGFLQNIYQCFRTFESRCNHVGKISYRGVRNDFFKKNPKIGDYLKMISEPGSLPLNLKRFVQIVVYNQITFRDLIGEQIFDLEKDYTKDDLLNFFDQFDFKVTEVPFSEKIIIRFEGHNNVIPDIQSLIYDINSLLLKLESSFRRDSRIVEIDKKIKELVSKQSFLAISFTFDGSYFPLKKEVEYAPSMEGFLGGEDGKPMMLGDDLFSLEKTPHFSGETFEETLDKFTASACFIFSNEKHEPHTGMMVEFITINRDGTYRYYMYPPTCAAKTYRKIREMALRGREEDIMAVMFAMCFTLNPANIDTLSKSAEERQETGTDMLTIQAYYDGNFYKSDIFITGPQFVRPKIVKPEEILHMVNPIVGEIKENEKKGRGISCYKKPDSE